MIDRIQFFAQDVAEKLVPKDSWAMISICCPGDTVMLRPGWKWLLKLEFDDVDKFISGYQSFSYEQAEEIVAFLRKASESVEVGSLFVHCGAGISRSAAVAMFAQRYFSTVERLSGTDNHNRLVRSMLEYQLNDMEEDGRFPKWQNGSDS